jgi:hypothetical protein
MSTTIKNDGNNNNVKKDDNDNVKKDDNDGDDNNNVKKDDGDNNIKKKDILILKKNKTSNNYSICRKIFVDSRPSIERIRYTLYNVILSFGCETYNDSIILNGTLSNSSNYNHNVIFNLKRILNTFTKLAENDVLAREYNIKNKSFNPFLKEIEKPKDDTNDEKNDEKNDQGDNKTNYDRYNIRMYVAYGVKIVHSTTKREVPSNALKGKRCNIDIELGSMWCNDNIKKYGINIFARSITVLN